MIGDDLLALLIGADVGLQERANRQMRERGEEPTFWQRHPMLPYVVGFVVGIPLVMALGVGLIGYAVLVTHLDTTHGNTGLIDIAGIIALFWVPRRVIRALRYRRQQTSKAVVARRGP